VLGRCAPWQVRPQWARRGRTMTMWGWGGKRVGQLMMLLLASLDGLLGRAAWETWRWWYVEVSMARFGSLDPLMVCVGLGFWYG